jgi:hypothetical protein
MLLFSFGHCRRQWRVSTGLAQRASFSRGGNLFLQVPKFGVPVIASSGRSRIKHQPEGIKIGGTAGILSWIRHEATHLAVKWRTMPSWRVDTLKPGTSASS